MNMIELVCSIKAHYASDLLHKTIAVWHSLTQYLSAFSISDNI